MSRQSLRAALLGAILLSPIGGCAATSTPGAPSASGAATHADWPQVTSPYPRDPAMERRIAGIVAGMTLEQKVGQMTQPEIRWIKPDDARRYYIGSVLNGGGSWPGMDMHASLDDWVKLSRAFYDASMSTDMKVQIPIIWGTDAVHGHNNLVDATLYPHNIGLGAAHDPVLVHDIAGATAKAVRASGMTWVFAPTLAVVQDERWGRSYESYSSDPALVKAYAKAAVSGLQGNLDGPDAVVATAKHYLGDGGTVHGKDQGETRTSLDNLIATHAQGYVGAIEAGVQTVMVSYSSFTDTASGKAQGKMHGNRALITDALKNRMGFDGLVVSDWNAIKQVPGCTVSHCPQAINAGIDMVMVSEKWREFIAATMADVREGRIPVSRIDDAVTRILRVKLRSGLFDASPLASPLTGRKAALADRDLARRAVRESLVLLKNDGGVLPLPRTKRVLVVGASANSMANQAGGWSITWQGDNTTNKDFGTGETLLAALRAQLGADQVVYSPTAEGVDVSRFGAVVAVLGETPYAEGAGDVTWPAPLRHSARFPADLAVLKRVEGHGVPVVSVLYSGRTTYANDLLNRSDAFVAAWLPGSEAGGIADLLLRGQDGRSQYDFRGTLPFAWPGTDCPSLGGKDAVLFPRGYGLRYSAPKKVGTLPVEPQPTSCETAQH